MRLGELARILTDSGQIFIASLSDIDDYDIEYLRMLTSPNDFIVVHIGTNCFSTFIPDIDIESCENDDVVVDAVYKLLRDEEVIPEYTI